jgi:GTPase Era involved in 16S rRNA processing
MKHLKLFEEFAGDEIESNLTLPQAVQILLAVAAGKSTVVNLGGGQATVTFRDLDDTKNRVVATLNNSNRTIITTDVD